ncbi:MAG: hypothetical protein JWO78_1004 [Micavibrio sp.]|nr:hypothetical protein [Micavibrio sp.]
MAGLDEQNGISKNFNEKSPVLLNPAQESLNKILTADKNQFVILGDTDHTNKNIIGFLAKEQTMAVLAQNGIKNLALEVRKEFQPLADKVSKGELSPRDYAEEKSRMYARQGDNSLDAKSLKSVMEGHIFNGR